MVSRSSFDDFDISEVDAKKFIQLGIKGDLQFEVMNSQTSRYQLLNQGQLQEIYAKHPERENICLKTGICNPNKANFDGYAYDQRINYSDLWFEPSKSEGFLNILERKKKTKHLQDALKDDDVISLETSPYWVRFRQLVVRALTDYPAWRDQQNRIQNTANLIEWLTKTIGANTREAEIIKKVLSDFYLELR